MKQYYFDLYPFCTDFTYVSNLINGTMDIYITKSALQLTKFNFQFSIEF